MSPAGRNRLWLAVALALTAAKLWLSRGQGVFAIGSAGHDDRLFLELAQHLVRGDWLGPYNELTLAKGPFYPMFIAASFLIGLPLFLAQHAFYAAACGAFARALRPAIASAGARCAIYALLLWNPMTYDAPSMGRVLRQQVYGPLALFVLAGLVALHLRRAEPGRRQWAWAVLAGAAAGCFYLTREEVVWFAPSVALLAAACVGGAWRRSRGAGWRSAGLLGLALAVAAVPVLTVCALNKRHYDWFGTCEFRAPEFRSAYGAMLRVQVGPELPYVPVTREARAAMARESPQFALLQRQFEEGGLAQGWAGASSFLTKLPAEEGQIGGGWFIWAVREAVAKAGHAGNAQQALIFHRVLAHELNRACDEGRLPAGRRRNGFMPPWRDGQTPAFVRATRELADFVIRFSRFGGRPPPSTGSPEELQLFRDLTRERLSPPAGELDDVGAKRYVLNLWKAGVLHHAGKALRPVLTTLFWVAQLLALARAGWLLAHRRWTYPLTVAAAAWVACAASIVIHALIEATSFPVLTISSFAPIYPLLLVFIVATLWDATGAVRDLRTARAATAAPPSAPAGREEAEEPAPPPKPDSIPLVSSAPASRAQRLLPWLAAGLALLPFLAWHRLFRELFWFADELFLLDQLTIYPAGQWLWVPFTESFVPLFKVLWGGSVFLFSGSYAAMLWLVWITHAVITLLLGLGLRRAGASAGATLLAQAIFALTPGNIETLGWSVQWSAMLAAGFMLGGLAWWARRPETAAPPSWRQGVVLALLAAASACSFSRGVVTGALFAVMLALPLLPRPAWPDLRTRLPAIALCLAPAVAVAVIIKLNASGLHQKLGGHWGEILEYGLSYFLLNPGHALFGGMLHPAALLTVAGAKIVLIAATLLGAPPRQRLFLLVFLAYDLGSALLVGIGRYDAGFLSAMNSRYQYSSLIATLPFAAVALDLMLARIPLAGLRRLVAVGVIGAAAAVSLLGWPAELRAFTGWRGTELRALMAAPATADPAVRVPALDFMHIERAKALQRAYNLH